MAIRFASEDQAIENQSTFNSKLRELQSHNGGGIEYYLIRGSSIVEYNPVDSQFYHSRDLNGYREHSLCAIVKLTNSEVDDIYFEVGLGVVDITIVKCHSLEAYRFWKGASNLASTRTRSLDKEEGIV